MFEPRAEMVVGEELSERAACDSCLAVARGVRNAWTNDLARIAAISDSASDRPQSHARRTQEHIEITARRRLPYGRLSDLT